MRTEIITGEQAIARAVAELHSGGIVALPTETVYGLAADALRAEAVTKIFETKERPRFDPLIVHLPDISWLQEIAVIPTAQKKIIQSLAEAFWPGPFTMVLPKTDRVPEIVTAGLETVAVRISAHAVFQEIIRSFGKPLAAPSANRFGRISPTTAQHVADELGGRIPLIVDGGPTTHGVESTVIAISDGQLEILRPGPVTVEMLRGIGFQPMNRSEPVAVRYGANLPHWNQAHGTYAVTFRLADALPAAVVEEWERERRDICMNAKQQGREVSEFEQHRLARLFSGRVEHYLDAGNGQCWLSDERIAALVRDALLFFNGRRYALFAWCIMPNHVHVVVQPSSDFNLSQILHSWKSFTAKRANQMLNRTGEFWQRESYDHMVRDEADLQNQIRYVEQNPGKSGLTNWPWVSRDIDSRPMIHRQDADATVVRSPGQLSSHYAPHTPLRLSGDSKDLLGDPKRRVGILAWNAVSEPEKFSAVRYLSENKDMQEAAVNLFRYLRELDDSNLDVIVAELVPESGLGIAINDRLRRAAARG